jgi:hypothetical protein
MMLTPEQRDQLESVMRKHSRQCGGGSPRAMRGAVGVDIRPPAAPEPDSTMT